MDPSVPTLVATVERLAASRWPDDPALVVPWLQNVGLEPAIPVPDGGFMGMAGWGQTRVMVGPAVAVAPIAVMLWIPTVAMAAGAVAVDHDAGTRYADEVRAGLSEHWGEPEHVGSEEGDSWSWHLPDLHVQLALPSHHYEDPAFTGVVLVGLTRESTP